MDKELLNFLKTLKQFGIENDIPNVSETGGRFLNMLVKILGAKQILEIGCANGYSTIWLAEAAASNKGKVSTIDFSKPSYEAAQRNLSEAGLSDYVDFYFGDALQDLPKIKEGKKFDFVFVDGRKRNYWDFWELIKDRLSQKSLVFFDNVLLFPDKTGSFMRKIKNIPGFDQVFLPMDKNDGALLLY